MRNFRYVVYAIVCIIILKFLLINLPFLYDTNSLDPIEFYSDINSFYNGLKFDKCVIDTIDDSTLQKVQVYFGCETKITIPNLPNNLPSSEKIFTAGPAMINNTFIFSENLLENDIPDYLVNFQFKIGEIGKSFIFYNTCVNQSESQSRIICDFTKLPIIHSPASHFKSNDNTFILELSEQPYVRQYSFSIQNFFKQTSYETIEMHLFMPSNGLYYKNDYRLFYNPPERLSLILRVPASNYTIINPENYPIKYDENLSLKDKIRQITIELSADEPFHIVLKDKNREFEKFAINNILLPLIIIPIIASFLKKTSILRFH